MLRSFISSSLSAMQTESDDCTEPALPLQFRGSGKRIPMIKPPVKAIEDQPSPLMLFVSTVTLLATTRKMLAGLGQFLGDAEWNMVLEDLALFLHDHAIIGLRTSWVRRVAVPVV